MWSKTPFDALDTQMLGTLSDKDKQYWARLEETFAEYPHSLKHVMAHWPVYARRILLTRFLAHYELFKMTLDLPGSIVELGVSRGTSFFTWHKLLELFAPMDTTKRVFGFDSFEGLTDFAVQDGAPKEDDIQSDKQVGGWSAGSVEGEMLNLAALTNADNVLARERSRLVKGRVQDTLEPFLAETPGLRINLLHFDLDLYEPTLFALERLWDLVVPGGVVVFDEYAYPPWGGEATAWEEFARARSIGVQMKKFPWCLTPSGYLTKLNW